MSRIVDKCIALTFLFTWDFKASFPEIHYVIAEYMQSGRATEKTDVYSFGVLILEVLSGKRPTDASFIEKGFNIVGWVCFLTACTLSLSLLMGWWGKFFFFFNVGKKYKRKPN